MEQGWASNSSCNFVFICRVKQDPWCPKVSKEKIFYPTISYIQHVLFIVW